MIREPGLLEAARKVYGTALRKKVLVPAKACSRCGKTGVRIHGHHDDYSKPLEVMWLCSSCHTGRHVETNTGHKGRPRCVLCGLVIYRHIMDGGKARECDGGFAHVECPERATRRISDRLIAVALKYVSEEASDNAA